MTNGDDDEPEKPKLKLVTESSGGESDGGDSGSNNVVGIGYSGEEPEDDDDQDDDVVDALKNVVNINNDSPASSVTHDLLRSEISDMIMTALNPRERSILELRFGLKDGKTRTLEEVAYLIGTTRERIRQLESQALRKLRHPNRSRRPSTSMTQSPASNFSWSEIQEKLSRFKSQDRRILKMLWGQGDMQNHPISEVAEKFNVSFEYVFELDKQARKIFE